MKFFRLEYYKILGLKINNILTSIILLLSIKTSFLCDQMDLNLTIRNNINGDFSIVKKIEEIRPGAFININWQDKNLMLPYSPRANFLSFSDKKWDWRYSINDDGNVNEKVPVLYELSPLGEYIEHKCQIIN